MNKRFDSTYDNTVHVDFSIGALIQGNQHKNQVQDRTSSVRRSSLGRGGEFLHGE